MLYLYGLMFSDWQRKYIISVLVISCFSTGSILRAQEDPGQMERAGAILEERGEVVFEFHPEDVSVLRNAFHHLTHQPPNLNSSGLKVRPYSI